ncbi:type II secretion system F family protein [Streptomyces sp. 130]|uniref:type II secretion system F family protein n=1 Tax=Streptomyces sp. 130 TaxID=2591006 RepID=UPI00117C0148|nr:type II secretion system F family protein [Streptomyces sp. 130]TRV81766.1 type II secretion system F family protein [Streptomyces sp. 130]
MNLMLMWVLAGLAVAGGLVGLVAGLVGTTAPRPVRRSRKGPGGSVEHDAALRRRTRWAAGGAVGLAVWVITGVFTGGLLVGAAVVGVPWLLSPTKNAAVRIDKLEALGEWTQRLSDVLRLGMGLEQAMIASRRGAPAELEHEIADLADRLQVGWRPAEALESFADALDDVTADKVLAALMLCASDRGPGLAQALEDLSEAVREEVGKRRQIEADRAKPRTTVRWMTIITLCVVGAGFLVPSYTAPYGTLLGQLVLALLTAAFAGVLIWMRSLADHRPVARFLIADPRSRVKLPQAPEPLQEAQS